VLVLFSRKLANRKIKVTRQFGRMDTIVAFPGEMRQIITNLISNAIEACTEGGKIIVRISSSVVRHQRGLRLSVADNGPGIPREVIARLGEPFFTTKGQAGTGLGLSVTKTILHSLGGNLSIRSSMAAKAHGSVFSIFLPINPQAQAQKPGNSRNNLQLVPPRERRPGKN
jgi:two-component system, NtrC family, sensor kinase